MTVLGGSGGASPVGAAEVRSLYVHAPFCARRCRYCDFAVDVRRKGDPAPWARALAGELSALEEEGRFRLADTLDTLYVGGGTPSLLGPDAMERLVALLGPSRLEGEDLEWTAEANPESFTPDVAKAWRRAGVNRISLGVQTFHEPALRWMGRLHGPDGARRAVAVARAAGFDDVSLDLIFALPEETERHWEADLGEALALQPTHVSLYGLSVEGGTPLGRHVAEGRVIPATEERYRDDYLLAAERLTVAGYRHYEVSNFALPGRSSRHNRAYWEGSAYLGLGNGAHSFVDPVRRWNLREWEAYARLATAGALPVAEEEVVTGAARQLERVWLGLRSDRGIPWAELGASARDLAEAWIRHGLATVAPPEAFEASVAGSAASAALRLTGEGWLLLDRLAVEMDAVLTCRDPEAAGV